MVFSGIPHLTIFFHICPYAHMPIMGIFGQRDVDLRSVRPSTQKLWPTTFFAKKMPCILHGTAKKIRYTISRQVSGLAQLPDDLKFIVDQESNT